MKKLILLTSVFSLFLFSACGGSSNKNDASEIKVAKEVKQLDSLSNTIDATNNEIENNAKALEQALEELEKSEQ